MSAYNSVDYLVLCIFAISMLAGLMRGFAKEAISLATWVVAAIIAMQFASPLANMFSGGATTAVQGAVGSSVNVAAGINMFALATSFIVLFVGTLLAGAIVNYLVNGMFSMVGLGMVNRLLGAGFGAVRGYLMVIIFMFVAELTPMGSQEAWGQSQFVQSFQPTVSWFAGMVNPALQSLKAMGVSAVENAAGSAASGASNMVHSFSK